MNKKLLIVVDMQNDFVTGVFGTPEAQLIVPKVVDKIRNWDGFVFYTQDGHAFVFGDADDEVFSIEEKTYPAHCLYYTEGYNFIPKIKDEFNPEQKYIFDKKSFSYEWWTNWGKGSLTLFDEIVLIGVCTDICVISNALVLRSLFPKKVITIDSSCCAGTTPEAHNMALEIMKKNCINII